VPFVNPTNNRVLPANARASDVAEKAISEIIPVQQRRAYDAFRVQGIECLHYNHLTQGRKCLCQSAQKQLNGILDETGKADVGTLNKMLTGNMSFNITPYDHNEDRVAPGSTARGETSPFAPVNKNQGVFDIKVFDEPDFPLADQVDGPDFGDNGPVDPIDIDQMVGDWDASTMGFSDVACPICFGTGFVGGFAPYHAHRQVFTVADVQLGLMSEIDTLARPWTAQTETGFNVITVLPAGALGADAFRVWNMAVPVNAQFTIDGTAITSVPQLLTYCDGKPHLIGATFVGKFSHFEIQFNLTTESVYFEFPRRPSSADTSLLEQMEPFQIIISPNCPTIASMDVIVESQLGKVLVVQNVNPWNSRQRNMLGWEVQVRVIQPMEKFRILPARGRVPTKNRTTEMVRDNVRGGYRT
jgi:hypothetical protein